MVPYVLLAWLVYTCGRASLILNNTHRLCYQLSDTVHSRLYQNNTKTIPKHILHMLQQHSSVVEECWCLSGKPAVLICPSPKTNVAPWHVKYDKRNPKKVKSFIWQEQYFPSWMLKTDPPSSSTSTTIKSCFINVLHGIQTLLKPGLNIQYSWRMTSTLIAPSKEKIASQLN